MAPAVKRSSNTQAQAPSQPARKKRKDSEIFNGSTANANGSRARSTATCYKSQSIAVKDNRSRTRENQKPTLSSTRAAYMATLLHSAPPAEQSSGHSTSTASKTQSPTSELPSEGSKEKDKIKESGTKLNDQETEFLDDLEQDFEEDKVADQDQEDEGDSEDERDEDTGDGSELIVEEVTVRPRSTQARKSKSGRGILKVLVSDFDDEKLAIFAKRCARMATCIIHMCPDNPLFCWPTFTEELELLGHEGRAGQFFQALGVIERDPEVRDQLVRFMSYGTTAVRLDMGKEARIRATQFFKTESLTPEQISWLLHERKYHHGEVNVIKETTNGLPFRSPLLGTLLRGYLIESKPRQDRLLIARLQSEKRIPIPLIAMLTVLIGHAIQEYSSGIKLVNAFSVTNLEGPYRSIMSTLTEMQAAAPAYIDLIQSDLYVQMMTHGPEVISSPTYDYNALNSFALESKGSVNNIKDGNTGEESKADDDG